MLSVSEFELATNTTAECCLKVKLPLKLDMNAPTYMDAMTSGV